MLRSSSLDIPPPVPQSVLVWFAFGCFLATLFDTLSKFLDQGDLLHFFRGHFDTTIGLKVESSSYENISKQVGIAAENTLFATDNIFEVRYITISFRCGSANKFHLLATFRPMLLRRQAGMLPWPTDQEIRSFLRVTTSLWWIPSSSC